ncbi:RNA polymerase sigma factor [Edaphobacter sp. HDX4]|uniref:RNA polymerase sigma factor n=1 Tax=Edaphobacter sp. HDX4 TaxID=2794064 RepID=UPI002FE5BED2
MSTHFTIFSGVLAESLEVTEETERVCAGRDPSLPLQSQVTALFDQLRAPLLRYLWDFRLTSDVAEELVQEAFLKLFEELRQGRNVEMPRPWLFRVAHRLALKEMRRLRIREGGDPLHDEDSSHFEIADLRPTPVEQVLLDEREHRLSDALQELSVRERQCLNLRVEGLRYREIADVMDISVTTVSETLRRAVLALHEACYE